MLQTALLVYWLIEIKVEIEIILMYFKGGLDIQIIFHIFHVSQGGLVQKPQVLGI